MSASACCHDRSPVDLLSRIRVELKRVASEPGIRRPDVDLVSRTRVELKHIAVTSRAHVLNQVDLLSRTRVELKRMMMHVCLSSIDR